MKNKKEREPQSKKSGSIPTREELSAYLSEHPSATKRDLARHFDLKGGEKIVLLKPGTYMNESGRSVRAAMDFFKLAPGAITVFHDELDILALTLKVKTGGGTAGQNGLKSIVQHIGPDFRRVRIGIGHPGHKDRVTGHVLSNWHKTEVEPLSDLLGAIAAEADWLAKGDDVRFMNDVALRMQN